MLNCCILSFTYDQLIDSHICFVTKGHEIIELVAGNEITLRTSDEWENKGSTEVSFSCDHFQNVNCLFSSLYTGMSLTPCRKRLICSLTIPNFTKCYHQDQRFFLMMEQ